MRSVAQQSYATIGNILRFGLPRGVAEFLVDSVDVDEASLVQAEFGFCLQDSAHRSIETFARDAAGLNGALQAFERGVGYRWHQQGVRAGLERADGCFAWREANGDTAHVQGVGDDQALKSQLFAQKIGENSRRQSRWRIWIRLERGHREMAGHDAACTCGDRGAKGN